MRFDVILPAKKGKVPSAAVLQDRARPECVAPMKERDIPGPRIADADFHKFRDLLVVNPLDR